MGARSPAKKVRGLRTALGATIEDRDIDVTQLAGQE
jgi:hypothetical protein